MNILFITELKILMLVKWSYRSLPPPPSFYPLSMEWLACFEHLSPTSMIKHVSLFFLLLEAHRTTYPLKDTRCPIKTSSWIGRIYLVWKLGYESLHTDVLLAHPKWPCGRFSQWFTLDCFGLSNVTSLKIQWIWSNDNWHNILHPLLCSLPRALGQVAGGDNGSYLPKWRM